VALHTEHPLPMLSIKTLNEPSKHSDLRPVMVASAAELAEAVVSASTRVNSASESTARAIESSPALAFEASA
jgi:hypothetical protein